MNDSAIAKISMHVSEDDLQRLLSQLCVEWGFCIPPEDKDEIAHRESLTAEEFANAVLIAEEMQPEYEQHWFRQIRDRFVGAFVCSDESLSVDNTPNGS